VRLAGWSFFHDIQALCASAKASTWRGSAGGSGRRWRKTLSRATDRWRWARSLRSRQRQGVVHGGGRTARLTATGIWGIDWAERTGPGRDIRSLPRAGPWMCCGHGRVLQCRATPGEHGSSNRYAKALEASCASAHYLNLPGGSVWRAGQICVNRDVGPVSPCRGNDPEATPPCPSSWVVPDTNPTK